jgi:hypothetical protein
MLEVSCRYSVPSICDIIRTPIARVGDVMPGWHREGVLCGAREDTEACEAKSANGTFVTTSSRHDIERPRTAPPPGLEPGSPALGRCLRGPAIPQVSPLSKNVPLTVQSCYAEEHFLFSTFLYPSVLRSTYFQARNYLIPSVVRSIYTSALLQRLNSLILIYHSQDGFR